MKNNDGEFAFSARKTIWIDTDSNKIGQQSMKKHHQNGFVFSIVGQFCSNRFQIQEFYVRWKRIGYRYFSLEFIS